MRFDINLASQPYQDMQRLLVRWGAALLVAVLIAGGLLFKAGTAIVTWKHMRAQIQSLQQQIGIEDDKKNRVQLTLNQPANRDTRDRSQFLNAIIDQKAFSWTEVFMDLERIVPAQLKVASIVPKVTQDDRLEVNLSVISPLHSAATELVRRLERSPHFSHAAIVSENSRAAQSNRNQPLQGDEVQFQIVAEYIPSYARAPGPEEAQLQTGSKKESTAKPLKGTAKPPAQNPTHPGSVVPTVKPKGSASPGVESSHGRR